MYGCFFHSICATDLNFGTKILELQNCQFQKRQFLQSAEDRKQFKVVPIRKVLVWNLLIYIYRGFPHFVISKFHQIKFKKSSHVHVLFIASNGEIDMVQFIFTRCVVYSLDKKLSLHKKVETERSHLNSILVGSNRMPFTYCMET